MGIFSRKMRPFDYGNDVMGEESLRYTQPVYMALMRFFIEEGIEEFSDFNLEDSQTIEFIVRAYIALGIFEFSLYQMKSSGFNVNEEQIREGWQLNMNNLASLYAERFNLPPLDYDIVHASKLFQKAFLNNVHFQNTGLAFDMEDIDSCLLADMLRVVITCLCEGDSFASNLKSETYKGVMLEAFTSLERGMRWIVKATDPKKIAYQ